MVSKSAFKQVHSTLKLIVEAKKLEEKLCEHFGSTSRIGAAANSATREVRGLLITILENFKDGLVISDTQAYRLARLELGRHWDGPVDRMLSFLSGYLSALTDSLIIGVEASDEPRKYVVHLNQDRLPRN